MEAELYYTAPSNIAFDEMRREAIKIWEGYEDPYRREKLDRIMGINNFKDNFMYIFAMFDPLNQKKLIRSLSEETKKELKDRLIDGGTPEWAIPL